MTKYKPEDDFSKFPKELLKKCYDKDQRVLFGSNVMIASIAYHYVPAELMEDNIPLIISTSISYDGGDAHKKDVAKGAMVMSFNELPSVFKNNKFN